MASKLFYTVALLLILLQPRTGASQEPEFKIDIGTSSASRNKVISSGKMKEALAVYESEARKAEKNAAAGVSVERNLEYAAAAYREASWAALESGQLQKAVTHGERALEVAAAHGSPVHRVRAVAELIDAYTALGNPAKVRQLIEKGLTIAKEISPATSSGPHWESRLYSRLGTELVRERAYEKAIDAFSRSIQLIQQAMASDLSRPNPNWDLIASRRRGIVRRMTRLGNALRKSGQIQQAAEQYQSVFHYIKAWELKYRYESELYQELGELDLERNNLAQALESFRRALSVAENQKRPGEISAANRRIGDLFLRVGVAVQAVPYYRKSIQQIESVRSRLQSDQFRQSYFESWLGSYVGMISSLWTTNPVEAFNYNERARSRVFLDVLGSKVLLIRANDDLEREEKDLKGKVATISARLATQAEGSDAVGKRSERGLREVEEQYNAFVSKARLDHKEQASLMSVEPLKLQDVQALLDTRQTLIEYFTTPEKLFVWVVTKNRLNALTVSISQTDLEKKVDALRRSIAELKPVREYQSLARNLHEILIRPALPHIHGKELIIVPHGVLHYLPFQALYSSQGRYLVEYYSVSYLSSASLIQFTKAKRRAVGPKILAVGNPSFDVAKVNLPMSELEADEIGRLFSRSTVLVKSEATEEKVKALSQNYDVLHFATHAELSKENPLSSAVLLAKGDNEDGRLDVKEIFGMDLNASLVVLSGCETGLGELSSGDELVGLTRAFIYAGTPSVMASLWKVDDASTAHLMSSFYKNLKTKTKVESLRQAQLEMIRGKVNTKLLAQRGVGGVGKLGQAPAVRSSNSITTSHPYFWAPFILVGDGK